MKNNLKTFFSIIILVIFFQKNTVFSKEEFNFDISQIEITDNGNKYKGLKRGTLISNNGLIIKSNKFNMIGKIKFLTPLVKLRFMTK